MLGKKSKLDLQRNTVTYYHTNEKSEFIKTSRPSVYNSKDNPLKKLNLITSEDKIIIEEKQEMYRNSVYGISPHRNTLRSTINKSPQNEIEVIQINNTSPKKKDKFIDLNTKLIKLNPEKFEICGVSASGVSNNLSKPQESKKEVNFDLLDKAYNRLKESHTNRQLNIKNRRTQHQTRDEEQKVVLEGLKGQDTEKLKAMAQSGVEKNEKNHELKKFEENSEIFYPTIPKSEKHPQSRMERLETLEPGFYQAPPKPPQKNKKTQMKLKSGKPIKTEITTSTTMSSEIFTNRSPESKSYRRRPEVKKLKYNNILASDIESDKESQLKKAKADNSTKAAEECADGSCKNCIIY